jgi:hypothetical protein
LSDDGSSRRSELTVGASVKVGGFILARVGRLVREVHGDADEAAEQSKSMRPSQS